MTIAALASAYASPQRGAVPPPVGASRVDTSAPSEPASSTRSDTAQRSRRNPLMDAMLSATQQRGRASSDQPVDRTAVVKDALKADSGAADAAVAEFAHALMDDLRTLAGSGEAKGWSDLSGSVAALAVKAGASSGGGGGKGTAEVEDVPPQPNPLTPTSAAVHLMQVPSSHLLKAYAAMRQAMPPAEAPEPKAADVAKAADATQAVVADPAVAKAADAPARPAAEAGAGSGTDGSSDPSADRAQLAQFLEKLSQTLAPQATEAASLSGLGTLVDTSA